MFTMGTSSVDTVVSKVPDPCFSERPMLAIG